MRFQFAAPDLSAPTLETLEEHSKKMFKKIERILPKNIEDPLLRISVGKDGEEFHIVAELHAFEILVVKTSDRDLRYGIDVLSHELKNLLNKHKEKRFGMVKMTDKIKQLRNKILNRDYIQ